ncbi:MAG: hypothetical protein R3E79_00200 [Caldilineaceae bacterium]
MASLITGHSTPALQRETEGMRRPRTWLEQQITKVWERSVSSPIIPRQLFAIPVAIPCWRSSSLALQPVIQQQLPLRQLFANHGGHDDACTVMSPEQPVEPTTLLRLQPAGSVR